MNELLGLFNYPSGSARALLAGTPLLLRYCSARFASLPVSGHAAGLVLLIFGYLIVVGLRFLVGRFTGLVVLDLEGKEFDFTEKPLHTS